MREPLKQICLLSGTALLLVGCTSVQNKFSRGVTNLREPLRMGELQRSFEQSYLWDGPESAYGKGLVRGFGRTVGRTLAGAVEVATFPIPSGPIFKPVDPVYPDSYVPDVIETSAVQTSNSLGFDSSDVAPMVPGSRFKVFR